VDEAWQLNRNQVDEAWQLNRNQVDEAWQLNRNQVDDHRCLKKADEGKNTKKYKLILYLFTI